MADTLLPLRLPPGLFRNGTKYQAKGRWFDGNLVRFFEGAIRPVQGWRVALDTSSNPMAALSGVPRNALAWRSAAGDALIAVGTSTKLYIIKNGTAYDITPSDFVAGGNDAANAGVGNYGHGQYGRGLYGRGAGTLASPLTDPGSWQLDAFGDTLVACPPGGGVYVWTVETTPSTPAAHASGSEDINRAAFVTSERFLVALGAASAANPGGDVRRVLWASQNTTDDWDITSTTNTAGDFYLPTNGRIMCGRRTKAQGLIWTDCDLYSMTYIGDPFIYSFKQEGDNCGIISPNAVAIVDTAAIWMGRDNFYAYDGFVKPIPCDVHDYVFDSFNDKQAGKVFACPVSEFGEIWWFYPSAGSVENDRYVVFNYRENHWMTGTLSRTAAIDRGAIPDPVMFDANGLVYTHEAAGGSRDIPLSTVLSDTLLDADTTNLSAHTPGGSPTTFAWSKVSGANLKFNASNGLHKDGSTFPIYVANIALSQSDYTASVAVHVAATAGQAEFGGVGARMTGTDAAGYYFGVLTSASGGPVFCLRGLDAAGATIFTDVTAAVPSALFDTDVTVALSVQGGVLTGYANGVPVCTKSDTTYTSGKAGVVGGWQVLSTSYAGTPDPIGTAGATGTSAQGVGYTFDHWQAAESLGFQLSNPTSSFPGTFQYLPGSPPGSAVQNVTLDRDVGSITVACQGANSPGKVEVFDVSDVLLATQVITGDSTDTNESHVITVAGIRKIRFTPATSGPADDVTWTCGVTSFVSATGGDSVLVIKGSFKVLGVTPVVAALATDGGAVFTAAGVTLTPFLESGPIEIGDGDRFMRIQRIIPDEKNLGDTLMRLWTAFFPTDTETENGPYSMTTPTDVRLTARHIRVRHEEVNDTNWRVGITRLGLTPGERR